MAHQFVDEITTGSRGWSEDYARFRRRFWVLAASSVIGRRLGPLPNRGVAGVEKSGELQCTGWGLSGMEERESNEERERGKSIFLWVFGQYSICPNLDIYFIFYNYYHSLK